MSAKSQVKIKSRSKLVAECDKYFSRYIRLKHSDKNGYCTCVTCGLRMKWNDKNCSCGHWITRAVQFLRRDERNARPQCMRRCNSKLSGNGEPVLFRMFLLSDIWTSAVEEMENNLKLYKADPKPFKVYDHEIIEKIQYYKEQIKVEAELRGIK